MTVNARHSTSLGKAEREKRNVALISVVAAVFITGFKLVVGIETNSLGILSEAAHSGLDFVAALMTYVAVRIADRPPDPDHPYGHGKIENLSAFIETLLLVITCAWIIWEALHRLLVQAPHVEPDIWGFLVIGTAIVVDIGRSRALSRAAKKHRSQALEADALHFSSDVWSSLVVLVGLVFVSLGYAWLDAVAAIGVAFLVLFVSYRLGRRTIDALMDRVPDGLYEQVLAAVRSVEGVEEIRSIRIRPSGANVFIDMTIAIRRTVPFQQAHIIMDNVERAIHEIRDQVDVIVHAEPHASTDETLADKIRMIVMRRGLSAPHNLEVHDADGKHHVDFDIEYDRGKSFVEAHEIASEVEEEIRREIPSVERLTIHMEETEADEEKASRRPRHNKTLEKKITRVLLEDRRVLGCSGITLLRVGERYNLSVNCMFDSSRTLDEIHQIVSQAETRLYDRFGELRRVTVHAEPK
jgi:cation diffusion facilitator family transporter